jgi:hypothetical protein
MTSPQLIRIREGLLRTNVKTLARPDVPEQQSGCKAALNSGSKIRRSLQLQSAIEFGITEREYIQCSDLLMKWSLSQCKWYWGNCNTSLLEGVTNEKLPQATSVGLVQERGNVCFLGHSPQPLQIFTELRSRCALIGVEIQVSFQYYCQILNKT